MGLELLISDLSLAFRVAVEAKIAHLSRRHRSKTEPVAVRVGR